MNQMIIKSKMSNLFVEKKLSTDWIFGGNQESAKFRMIGVEEIKYIIKDNLLDNDICKSDETDELQRCVSFASNWERKMYGKQIFLQLHFNVNVSCVTLAFQSIKKKNESFWGIFSQWSWKKQTDFRDLKTIVLMSTKSVYFHRVNWPEISPKRCLSLLRCLILLTLAFLVYL